MKFILPQSYLDEGLIRVQTHPTLPLRIYNYTEICQFSKKWDEITLQCRGLIVDENDEIVARPFKKFFNYEEHVGPLPEGTPEIIEKMDGSLGILFWYRDAWHLATRGSFTSDQALHGLDTLSNKYRDAIVGWPKKHFTHLFEIIYPQNRIVVDYGATDDLVYLGSVETDSGVESSDFIALTGTPFKQPKSLGFASPDLVWLKSLESHNAEGFVLRWPNGFRLKVKFEEYKRLHAILTGVTARKVWECLKDGTGLKDWIQFVPDEFMKWIKETSRELNGQFNKIFHESTRIYKNIVNSVQVPTPILNETFGKTELEKMRRLVDKEISLRIETLGEMKPFVYGLHRQMRSLDWRNMIWDSIKPPATKPFKIDV